MRDYKVFHSSRFDKELTKYNKSFQERIDKIEDQISENPYTGSPLNVKWFREKRYEKYRIYFLIYEDLKSVIMVGISEKKDQQKVINTIRLLFSYFKTELEELIRKEIT
jgi:mRNA-degrading endonuclease RelE of RelBE toxin-antitoxin system